MNNRKDFRISILEDFWLKIIWKLIVCYNSCALVFSNTLTLSTTGMRFSGQLHLQVSTTRSGSMQEALLRSSSLGAAWGVQSFLPPTQSACLGKRTFPPGHLQHLWAHQLPGVPPLSPTDPLGYQDNQEMHALTGSTKHLVCPWRMSPHFSLCNIPSKWWNIPSDWSSLGIHALGLQGTWNFLGMGKNLKFQHQRQLNDLLREHGSTSVSSQEKSLSQPQSRVAAARTLCHAVCVRVRHLPGDRAVQHSKWVTRGF